MSFVVIDWLGGIFSVLSLVFKEKFDVIAGITYALVIVRVFLFLVSICAHDGCSSSTAS